MYNSSRSNFRVKLDLCKYYQDVRRFCWIFIDGSKILYISHMKEHITKRFNIKEPFHLLLNDTEYLPPTEDIRVLKENETILVSPGSGLEIETELSVNTTMVPDIQIELSKSEKVLNSIRHTEAQTVDLSLTKVEPLIPVPQDMSIIVNGISSDVSVADMTFHSIIEDNETSSINESKANESNTTEEFSILENSIPASKRKRIRRKKSKKQTPLLVKNITNEESKSKKPKIIDSFIISSGKHIRFSEAENDEIALTQKAVQSTSSNGSYSNINPCSKELSTLLSLGQSSTPLTFMCKKVKQEVKIEHASDEETRISVPSEKLNTSTVQEMAESNLCKSEFNAEGQSARRFPDKDLEALPVLTAKSQLKDIIAFKMLKIAADYTPQVSEFIVAEVISVCPKTAMYTLQVLQGISEIQVPIGKFTLDEDETTCVVEDTITLNQAQIIEPRLISTSDGSRTPVLVNV